MSKQKKEEWKNGKRKEQGDKGSGKEKGGKGKGKNKEGKRKRRREDKDREEEKREKKRRKQIRTKIYMDDRTILTTKARTLAEETVKWEKWSAKVGLLENENKKQLAAKDQKQK